MKKTRKIEQSRLFPILRRGLRCKKPRPRRFKAPATKRRSARKGAPTLRAIGRRETGGAIAGRRPVCGRRFRRFPWSRRFRDLVFGLGDGGLAQKRVAVPQGDDVIGRRVGDGKGDLFFERIPVRIHPAVIEKREPGGVEILQEKTAARTAARTIWILLARMILLPAEEEFGSIVLRHFLQSVAPQDRAHQ